MVLPPQTAQLLFDIFSKNCQAKTSEQRVRDHECQLELRGSIFHMALNYSANQLIESRSYLLYQAAKYYGEFNWSIDMSSADRQVISSYYKKAIENIRKDMIRGGLGKGNYLLFPLIELVNDYAVPDEDALPEVPEFKATRKLK